jgi:hypothetical protein
MKTVTLASLEGWRSNVFSVAGTNQHAPCHGDGNFHRAVADYPHVLTYMTYRGNDCVKSITPKLSTAQLDSLIEDLSHHKGKKMAEVANLPLTIPDDE